MAFRISNAISFPEGPARMLMGKAVFAGKTDFQMVADTSKRIMYFKHYDYPNWRSIEVNDLAGKQKVPMTLNPAKGPDLPSAIEEMEPMR